jgi:hypothetical protein
MEVKIQMAKQTFWCYVTQIKSHFLAILNVGENIHLGTTFSSELTILL